MYGNDLLMMCLGNVEQARAMLSCFNSYCLWLGQKANFEKSSIMFSKMTNKETRRELLKNMVVQEIKRIFVPWQRFCV